VITLFHAPNSRSDSIAWLLEELAVPYETKIVDIRRADGTGKRDPANPHPHGKVPTVVDGEDTVFETGAITVFLTDKYPAAKLGPLPGQKKRGEYLSWLAYRSGVFEPAILSRRFDIKHVYGAMGWAPAEEVEGLLNARLSGHPYLLGDSFSAADLMIGGTLNFLMTVKMVQETPVLKDYASRVTDRPAYKKVMQRDKR
jgi:glutathione S-transferase